MRCCFGFLGMTSSKTQLPSGQNQPGHGRYDGAQHLGLMDLLPVRRSLSPFLVNVMMLSGQSKIAVADLRQSLNSVQGLKV